MPGTDRIAAIHAQLLHAGLDLSPAGVPGTPLIIVELDDFATATPATVARAAGVLRESLPLTIGVLRSPSVRGIEPVLDALTLTLTEESAQRSVRPHREVVPVLDVDAALEQLTAAVAYAPQAALACGQLLRRTDGARTTSALAAEAAVYSMLLSGNEFARWLGQRDEARPARASGVLEDMGPGGAWDAIGGSGPGDVSEVTGGADFGCSSGLGGDLVRMQREGTRLSIVLNQPARRNALGVRLREELLSALTVAEADPAIEAVALSGAGPVFCSGGDLDEFGAATDPVAAYLVRLDRAPWRVLDRVAERLTAHVHGACIGAGAEMAAFASHIVAAPDTWFRFPEVAMGLIPGAGGTVSVPRRIGRWRAAWLMLTGTPLSARKALRWGLVDEVTGTAG
ncbi:enoyl-CoA hydratase/isomerase family protein [Nocardia sp. GCM10030253]|uniref:enoyl-CoA hydratase/isomerase family protein n=1 Tax=Nocardia sp. GCM10030253 TaxID=3273404 RepID=UPI00363993D4